MIKQSVFIDSIHQALQFISYYHPKDFISAMSKAYEMEQSAPAKDSIAQILSNSKMSALGKRPLCQDTGIVVIFLKIGMEVKWDKYDLSIDQMVNLGVARAYSDPSNTLRASILNDPAGTRTNTKNNTPAVIHYDVVPGDQIDITVSAKGGGSENKAKFVMLNPSDSIVNWILDQVPKMGAGWCPPGIIGVGIGGSAEKSMVLAKESLMEPINIESLMKTGPSNKLEELRLELYEKINQLGIGAQGLGGLVTVLDVKIKDYPTHAASLPVSLIPNCAATRHLHYVLNNDNHFNFEPPNDSDYPDIKWSPAADAKKINLDTLKKADLSDLKIGETLLLTGKILTGRDAAHKKIVDLIKNKKPLPNGLDFTNKFIYYVGPVDPINDEVVGPAGPTTATRMDKFVDEILSNTGLIGMIGKAERSLETNSVIKKHSSIYLIAVGGAAFLVSKAIKKSRVVAFEELGMEAVYEFYVEDMPVTVAVDIHGESIHQNGPNRWRKLN